jgi:hypothetical protein
MYRIEHQIQAASTFERKKLHIKKMACFPNYL